jgi:hypothetical protein
MRLAPVVALLAIVLVVGPHPSSAHEKSEDGHGGLIAVGTLFIGGANLIAATLLDGSVAFGIAGIAAGSTLTLYASLSDTVDDRKTAFVAIGVSTLVISLADIVIARANDPELLGMQIDPSVRRFDGEQWYGVQLSRSW